MIRSNDAMVSYCNISKEYLVNISYIRKYTVLKIALKLHQCQTISTSLSKVKFKVHQIYGRKYFETNNTKNFKKINACTTSMIHHVFWSMVHHGQHVLFYLSVH